MKIYLGFECQLAFNRSLIQDKTENTLQSMARWSSTFRSIDVVVTWFDVVLSRME